MSRVNSTSDLWDIKSQSKMGLIMHLLNCKPLYLFQHENFSQKMKNVPKEMEVTCEQSKPK